MGLFMTKPFPSSHTRHTFLSFNYVAWTIFT